MPAAAGVPAGAGPPLAGRRGRRARPPAVLPAALVVLLRTAECAPGVPRGAAARAASGAGDTAGAGAGALLIGPEDLLRMRNSLGRVSDELRLILGVLDRHLEGAGLRPPPVASTALGDFAPLPRAGGGPAAAAEGSPAATDPAAPRLGAAAGFQELLRPLLQWGWVACAWLLAASIFLLDVGIVVVMQLFLESIGGRKKGGAGFLQGREAGSSMSAQLLALLSQEELLAQCLAEHWAKGALGLGLAVACRLPQYVLHRNGFLNHMTIGLAVVLRCLGPLVLIFMRDDMAMPKKAREAPERGGPPREPGSPRAGGRRRGDASGGDLGG